MRLALIIAAVLVTIGVALGSMSVAAKQRPECKPRGRVLDANGTAILWRSRGETFACVWQTGRTRSFGAYENTGGGGTYAFRLAGRYLAYDELACDPERCFGGLTVRDLVKRRNVKSIPIAPNTGLIGSLVLKPNGSVAWIRYNGGAGAEVRKADASGQVVLDTVPKNRAASLALTGSRLYWTHDTEPRTAELR